MAIACQNLSFLKDFSSMAVYALLRLISWNLTTWCLAVTGGTSVGEHGRLSQSITIISLYLLTYSLTYLRHQQLSMLLLMSLWIHVLCDVLKSVSCHLVLKSLLCAGFPQHNSSSTSLVFLSDLLSVGCHSHVCFTTQ